MTSVDDSARTEPSTLAGEREMLEGWLDYHRQTLALKCRGLDQAQLSTASAPPSNLTLLGLVRHMADVERGWFRRIMAGERAERIYSTPEDTDRAFRVTDADSPGETWEETHAVWQREIEAARAVAAAHGLDEVGVGKHPSGEVFNLRWIYTHMIEEYARHNGHADLLRERIDGATGD